MEFLFQIQNKFSKFKYFVLINTCFEFIASFIVDEIQVQILNGQWVPKKRVAAKLWPSTWVQVFLNKISHDLYTKVDMNSWRIVLNLRSFM
jgi:hypothetical protein